MDALSRVLRVWGGDRMDEMEQRLAGADYEAIFAAGGGILSSG